MAPCRDCSDGFHHYIWLIIIAPPAGQAPGGGGGAPGAPLTARLTAPAAPRCGVLEVAPRAVAHARPTARGRRGGTGGYGGNC